MGGAREQMKVVGAVAGVEMYTKPAPAVTRGKGVTSLDQAPIVTKTLGGKVVTRNYCITYAGGS